MKKLLIVSLSLLMCLSFVGCSNNDSKEVNKEESNVSNDESVAAEVSDIFELEDETDDFDEDETDDFDEDEEYYYDEEYTN